MATTYVDQLRTAAEALERASGQGSTAEDAGALQRVNEATERFSRASSASNFGFHACIYYRDFQPPPPGAHFASEWGLQDMFQGTTGDWVEYDRDQVRAAIMATAGDPDIGAAKARAEEARSVFREEQATVVSVLTACVRFSADEYVGKLKEKAESLSEPTEHLLSRAALSRFSNVQMMSRDAVAIGQGIHLAPHELVNIEVRAISLSFDKCRELATMARRAADHIERLNHAPSSQARQVGSRVFIGHGRSLLWRELKDFVSDRINLPYDEFNRVPVAGTTNVDRLSEMMDNAAVAFLVLTAEDERSDGTQVARQNVVHEAGLFQGRLGFSRAVVMLEEGCEPFSNIDGLGQLRFPAGRISALFEDVRRVLEREGLVAATL